MFFFRFSANCYTFGDFGDINFVNPSIKNTTTETSKPVITKVIFLREFYTVIVSIYNADSLNSSSSPIYVSRAPTASSKLSYKKSSGMKEKLAT